MSEFDREIEGLIREFLRIGPAVHKRQLAIRKGVRDSIELEPGCDHSNWSLAKQWCEECGVTRFELLTHKGPEGG